MADMHIVDIESVDYDLPDGAPPLTSEKRQGFIIKAKIHSRSGAASCDAEIILLTKDAAEKLKEELIRHLGPLPGLVPL